jgi:hypothetical protein
MAKGAREAGRKPLPQPLRGATIGCADIIPRARG